MTLLEAVVFSQDPLTCCSKEHNLYTSILSNNFGMSYEFENSFENVGIFEVNNYAFLNSNNSPSSELLIENVNQWDHHQQQQRNFYSNYSSPEEYLSGEAPPPTEIPAVVNASGDGVRRKRRRRSGKNKEEVEQQRMTHIAVERNRRKQMNEYLAVIRSLMPPSYAQRGDQASIVGGAINYVKELEQLLQSTEAQKKNKLDQEHQQNMSPPVDGGDIGGSDDSVVASSKKRPPVFADFFSFPQYSTRNSVSSNSGMGEIEVTMVDSHANVKILAEKQPKQLVKLIAGFQGLRLNVLHLNVTTVDSCVLYSLSVKVEEGCQLNSVDDIATAANHILRQIQEEAADLL